MRKRTTRRFQLVVVTLFLASTGIYFAVKTPAHSSPAQETTSQGPTITETFATSLHGTRRGKQTWYSKYNEGFEALTGIPIDQLTCLKCHPGTRADGTPIDTATYRPDCSDCHVRVGDQVSQETCLKCHRRQATEITTFRYTDVHRELGFTCRNCHTKREMHGDGNIYLSWLEPGAMDVSCETCHKTISATTSHNLHRETVDCTACHAQSVISCYNCHFESEVAAGVKRPYGVLRGFTLLVRRQGSGKIYPATIMALTYQGKSFVAIAPYRAHNIVTRGRSCRECHANAAITEYARTGQITVTRWDERERRLIGPSGVIPVPPDWQRALRFDFVDYTGDPRATTTDPTKWVFLKSGADKMQMLYAKPLTREQIEKLAQ
ncbi:MAG: cytochrome c3 family protein [Blastocatellia bacterium]|nr:cytochrome c3 family protein [Blastocatellia bacterium]MCS7157077.1 cytochrome c3 family protein [Blastocatellia bacterium]MCX7752278.1 cytochrome c3 family protein [Blastocatellia bacterium]MDW8167770.1 hypothetical protein [Acidobacteriota bacterium]MDW8256591.1 hypothetical protein [Acidobacteriota bacterium]